MQSLFCVSLPLILLLLQGLLIVVVIENNYPVLCSANTHSLQRLKCAQTSVLCRSPLESQNQAEKLHEFLVTLHSNQSMRVVPNSKMFSRDRHIVWVNQRKHHGIVGKID